jgi:glycosyl hydrolase family 39 (putative alpha-L-iduronidase)
VSVVTIAPLLLLAVLPGASNGARKGAHAPRLVVSNWPGAVTTSPRPPNGAVNVPAASTVWCELAAGGEEAGEVDPIALASLHVELLEGEQRRVVVERGAFAEGFHGRLFVDGRERAAAASAPGPTELAQIVELYVVPDRPLAAATECTVTLRAASQGGAELDAGRARFSFRTRGEWPSGPVALHGSCAATVDFAQRVFSGTLQPDFDTTLLFDQLPTCELLQQISGPEPHPAAASLERDWPLCGDYWTNAYFDGDPNFVRERETRRVVATEAQTTPAMGEQPAFLAWQVHVEALPEAALYGIAADRPLAPDHPVGSRVLIADESRSIAATVQSVDEEARVVTLFAPPDTPLPAGWRAPPPPQFPPDDPRTPGNFARGLVRLLRLDPPGTPAFWFGRVDHQWDLVHARFGRRLVINFDRVPVDLSSDGVVNGGKGMKCAREWHEVVRTVTAHLIDRYGRSLADSYVSIANEPDLGSYFWSDSRRALFDFYDVTVDGVLRAFEERALPAERVKVGGLELAALAPKPDLLPAFLAHCSPKGGDPKDVNAAVANRSLDGLRSRRVETLVRGHGGRGSPCDFLSLHQYKHAAAAWQQLLDARATALSIDGDFFESLALTAFESDPDWNPTRDPATRDMFLGNGFWPAWAADWTRRALEAAQRDRSFARHEALLTVWPLDRNLAGLPALSFVLDRAAPAGAGDGAKATRPATVPKDMLRFLEVTGWMGTRLFLINGVDFRGVDFRGTGGSVSPGDAPAADLLAPGVAGFGGATADDLFALVYGHDPRDPENRDPHEWEVALTLDSFPFATAEQTLFAIDATHASPFEVARSLFPKSPPSFTPEQIAALEQAAELRPIEPPRRIGVEDSRAPRESLTTTLRVPGNGIRLLRWRLLR